MDEVPLFFRTSGIRGRSNEIITPELALRVGRAFAYWIKEKYTIDIYHIYVGHDNRRNSDLIAACVVSALSSSGINVIKFHEPVPTPLVIHATVNNDSQGGVMITGSHLPATDNGIILFDHLGNYYKGPLDDHYEPVDWNELGKVKEAVTEINEYKLFITYQALQLKINKNNWKVLIDTVHGPMREYVRLATLQFTKDSQFINSDYDDTFPGRNSEPTPESIENTRKMVLDLGCDLGIATDMDGDRVLFITKTGRVITGDYLGAILANIFWKKHPKLPIIAPINTSGIIEIAAKPLDGIILYCHVGPPSIIEAIRESGAKFGFEETGKYIFSDIGIWPDAAITTLFLVSLLQESEKSLDELVEELPMLYSTKTKISGSREKCVKTLDKLVHSANSSPRSLKEFVDNVNNSNNFTIDLQRFLEIAGLNINSINTMDGLRINLSNDSYLMIRPSGTENYMRIFCEHPSQEGTKMLNLLGQEIVNQFK